MLNGRADLRSRPDSPIQNRCFKWEWRNTKLKHFRTTSWLNGLTSSSRTDFWPGVCTQSMMYARHRHHLSVACDVKDITCLWHVMSHVTFSESLWKLSDLKVLAKSSDLKFRFTVFCSPFSFFKPRKEKPQRGLGRTLERMRHQCKYSAPSRAPT